MRGTNYFEDLDSDDGAVAEARRLLEGALIIHCAERVVDPSRNPSGYLLLHIDPAGRPDVADMPRAINSENMGGPASVGWRFVLFPDDAVGVMDVEFFAPVRCAFSVALAASGHREVLEQILADKTVTFSTACPKGLAELPPTATVTVGPSALVREALARVGPPQ